MMFRKCVNCGELGRCLCFSCIRAIVITAVLIEAVHWIFARL
jgi:hypothetical protein